MEKEKNSIQKRDQKYSLSELLDRIHSDDPSSEDMDAFRVVLRENENWKISGDLVTQVEDKIIESLAGENVIARESYKEAVRQIRLDLDSPHALTLEKLLIDQVVMTWLHYNKTMYHYDRRLQSGELLITQAELLEKRLNGAHRRYHRALSALARFRKTPIPKSVQLNISDNQVNISDG